MALDEVVNIKGRLIHYLSSFFCFIPLLIIFGFSNKASLEKSAFMTALAILSLGAVFMLYKRIRLIEDTATTDLNSAAQGYMALSGTVSLYEGEIVRAPKLELPPMIWYRNITSESWSGFIISDEKGRRNCLCHWRASYIK